MKLTPKTLTYIGAKESLLRHRNSVPEKKKPVAKPIPEPEKRIKPLSPSDKKEAKQLAKLIQDEIDGNMKDMAEFGLLIDSFMKDVSATYGEIPGDKDSYQYASELYGNFTAMAEALHVIKQTVEFYANAR